MKKKPDAMVTMIMLFCVGLVVSGFSSMSVGSDGSSEARAESRVERSAQVSYDHSVGRF